MANILIVDDSRTSRKILTNILTAQGYTVVGEARDGKEGVEKFKELKPDIVTLDITMPVMDGLEALREIRELDSKVSIIMITAAGQKEKMVDAIKHGASEFITKPFAEDEVIKAVQKVLG